MPQHKIPYLNLDTVNGPLLASFQELTAQIFQNSNYINGAFCKQFEQAYAAYSGTGFCTGVSNGLDALILSLTALGIGPGDEVIVPANTYIATWLAVTHSGATIIPVDCDLLTYNIDVNLIEANITSRTKAIIPVHLYGLPCDMAAIMHIAAKHNLFVVEDNAQAQGAKVNNQKTGTFGHINATSFYPGKNLGAIGDAGAVTTNNPELYNRVVELKNYGSAIKYQHNRIGYNNRLDELQAAFLSLKLSALDSYNSRRRAIALAYSSLLAGITGLVLPKVPLDSEHIYHIYSIRTNKRDELKQHLLNQGVETLIHYPTPPYMQKAYLGMGIAEGAYPNADEVAKTCLSLPIYPGLSDGDIEFIASAIITFFS